MYCTCPGSPDSLAIENMEVKIDNVWVTKRNGEILIGSITRQQNGDYKFTTPGDGEPFWVCLYKKENVKWQATRGSNKTKNYDPFEIEQLGKAIEAHHLTEGKA